MAVCTCIPVLHYLVYSKLEFDILIAKVFYAVILTNLIPTAITAFIIIILFKNSNKTSISFSILKALVFMSVFLVIDIPIINFFFGKEYLFKYVVIDIPYSIQNGFLLELFWMIQKRKCV